MLYVPRAKSHLSVRLPPRMRMELEETARASHRTLTGQVLFLLRFGLDELRARSPRDELLR